MPVYLADSSIWAWANKRSRPDIQEKLADRLERDEMATCVPVALEVMHRAEAPGPYEEIFNGLLAPLRWLDISSASARRALEEVQRELAGRSQGNHRHPAVDYFEAEITTGAGH